MLTLSVIIFGFIPMSGALYLISKKSYDFKDLTQLKEMAITFFSPAGVGFIYFGIMGGRLLEILTGAAFLCIGYYDLYRRVGAAGGKEGLKNDPLYRHCQKASVKMTRLYRHCRKVSGKLAPFYHRCQKVSGKVSEKVTLYITKVQKSLSPKKVACVEK
ncbi:MAG: hypothetical protein HQM14_11510 [SAR324 cluster bacterium]|nr:hypothetical protein [SAR324 cluster bacterium]